MENTELFDDYVNKRLSKEDREAFEHRIENEAALAESFEEYQLIVGGIEFSAAHALKQKLVEHEKGYRRKKTDPYLFYKVAAGLILLSVISYLIIQYSFDKSYPELYAEYYNPYPNVIDPLNRADNNNDLSIYQLYESQQYAELIERIGNETQTDSEIFYLGQSYLALNKTDLAIERFKSVTEESNFYEVSQWYLALAYLKSQDTVQLNSTLKIIVSEQGDYSNRAQKLLEDL